MGKIDSNSNAAPAGKARLYLYESSIIADNDEEVKIRVEFPGTGTTGYTLIRTYPGNDKNLLNEGEAVLGKGGELKEKGARISVSPVNIAPNEDLIRVDVYANGGKIASHSNPKSECSEPLIRVKLSITLLLIIFCSALLHG